MGATQLAVRVPLDCFIARQCPGTSRPEALRRLAAMGLRMTSDGPERGSGTVSNDDVLRILCEAHARGEVAEALPWGDDEPTE